MGRGGYRTVKVTLYPPIDKELLFLKKYYRKESIDDASFIRWLIHETYGLVVRDLVKDTAGAR